MDDYDEEFLEETDYLEARNLDPHEVMPLHGRGQKA